MHFNFLLLFLFLLANKIAYTQCNLSLTTTSTNTSCVGCSDGSVSVNITGGTAPFIYSWTNNLPAAGTVNIFASKDNSIFEQTTDNSNGIGQNLVAGETNAGFKNRALLAFNIAGNVPSNATITNASLKINLLFTSGASGPQTQNIHKVLQNWGEGTSNATQPGQGVPATTNDATWLTSFYPGTVWSTPGGTFNTIPSASTVVDGQAVYTWSSSVMASDVQSWLTSPSTNYGWMLKGNENGLRQAKRYGSRENVVPGNVPVLTVNYGPAIIGTTSTVSNLPVGTYTVTITDANLCTSTTTVTISANTPIPTTIFTQEATTYRGAFAPAPARQWTESWTNFDPQNTSYGLTNVTVSSDIVASTTWTANNVYFLDGPIHVTSGVTLTIEPGTIIRGKKGVFTGVPPNQTVVSFPGALVVSRGGKIQAEGTQCKPIVFTSNEAVGSRNSGDWGGVILLGSAKHNLGTSNLIEGLPNDPLNLHGGTNDDDNSGVLKYVRIEYSGFVFSANNEINGLTMGSVGRGTTLDYIQVTRCDDDAFEWFGGSVNAKHLVAYQCKDDDLDTDNGFSGTIQYALCIKDPNFSDASQSEGFESDNSSTGVNIGNLNAPGVTVQAPKTSVKFLNVTQIGAFRCGSNANASGIAPTALFLHRRGARVRRNSDHKIFNSILMNNWRGLFVDDAIVSGFATAPTTTNFNEDSAAFRNNIIAGDFTTTWTGTTYNGTKSLAYENAATRTIGTNAIYANDSINTCSLLLDPWNTNPSLADFRPNVLGAGALVTDPTNLLAGGGADLSPITVIATTLFAPNASQPALVSLIENGAGATNGAITIEISKPSVWDFTFNPAAIDDGAGTPVSNTSWTVTANTPALLRLVSKPGFVIEKNGFTQLLITVQRKPSTPSGSQSLSVSCFGGGDSTIGNNVEITGLSAN